MTESIAVPVPKTLDAANGSGLVEPVQQSKEQHRAKSQFSETAPDIASTYKTPIDKSTSVSPSSTANQPQTSWQEQRQWQAQSQRGAHTSGRKSSTPSMASMSKRTIVTDMYRPKVSLGSARENGKDQMASLNPISDKGYKSAPKKPLVIKGRIKHPHLAAVYSMHQLASDLAKEKRTSLKVSYFLQQSSHFISAAHEHLARFKQNYNWENYHKLVKAALRCLMLLWRKYEKDMTPRQRIVVCYRIAEIYLNETESFEVAEKYINMAIKICKSEELVEQEFYCDLLLIKVLEKTNVAVAIEHVEMKISEYGEKKIGGCQLFAECLTLIRVHYSLVDDFPVASIKLQRLVKGKQLHPSLHILASIYQAGLLIHRGDPVRAITILKEVDQVQLGSSHPFKAYLLLTTMLALLTSNDIPGAKRVLNELAFVRDESKKTNWDQWSANGETKIKIKIKVDEKEDQLTFSFPWLLKSEFLAITYFYSGLIYLNDRRTNARDYFKKALISTKEDLNSNRLAPMRFLRDRLVKSKTFRSFIQLYQQYYAFGMDDYRALYIKDLVTLNNKGIPRFEYLYLKPQLPITNYIFALYCHRKGDLQAAKYYYALVRNMTIDVDKNTDNLESLNQLTSGVECDSCRPQGKFNELYIYSSLQLVVLLDYEARELERRQGRTNSESATAWRNGIADELRAATLTEHGSDLFQYNFLSKNRLVLFTISIVLQLLNDADPNFFDSGEDVHSVLASLGEKPAFYLIHFLLSFALSAQMGASKDQEKAFEKALSVLPSSKSEPLRENGSYSASTSEVADSCRVMILRALHKNLTSNSDLGRAETNDLQQQRLCKLLSPSYNFLAKNVVVEGAEMKG
ncbi:uncharacterized protein LODBEIA_P43850 [Lodderomyces beijingensis]|uniref:Cohesin loading factor n=1 Tax=Lodderomyces beijingensis TaxID=1775926 RepID=A0ABP0ZST3_9ASCO